MNNKIKTDSSWTAKAIDKIIEINKLLPEDDKKRVLFISQSSCQEIKGYDKLIESIKKALEETGKPVSSFILL